MKINEKIYSLRKEKGLSQEELADKLNVSRQTVSKWELGDSTPDFDKIVPLCEVFGISAEELLRDKKTKTENLETNKPNTKKALFISLSVFLYFVAIAFIVLGEEFFNLNDGLLVSVFLLIIGIATGLIIFTCMTMSDKKCNCSENCSCGEECTCGCNKKKNNPVENAIITICTFIALGIYLLVSFTTNAWHITWIIWVIYAIVVRIIKLAFSLKEENNEK